MTFFLSGVDAAGDAGPGDVEKKEGGCNVSGGWAVIGNKMSL